MTGAPLHPQQELVFVHTVERREASVGRHVNVRLGVFLFKFLLYEERWTMSKGRCKECQRKDTRRTGCRKGSRRQGQKDARVSEE